MPMTDKSTNTAGTGYRVVPYKVDKVSYELGRISGLEETKRLYKRIIREAFHDEDKK